MDKICGERALLGRVLVEQGAVNDGEVEFALRTQIETVSDSGKSSSTSGWSADRRSLVPLPGNQGVDSVKSAGFGTGPPHRSSAGTATGATSGP